MAAAAELSSAHPDSSVSTELKSPVDRTEPNVGGAEEVHVVPPNELSGDLLPFEAEQRLSGDIQQVFLGWLVPGRVRFRSPQQLQITKTTAGLSVELVPTGYKGEGASLGEAIEDLHRSLASYYFSVRDTLSPASRTDALLIWLSDNVEEIVATDQQRRLREGLVAIAGSQLSPDSDADDEAETWAF
jgi:hypothetical protein